MTTLRSFYIYTAEIEKSQCHKICKTFRKSTRGQPQEHFFVFTTKKEIKRVIHYVVVSCFKRDGQLTYIIIYNVIHIAVWCSLELPMQRLLYSNCVHAMWTSVIPIEYAVLRDNHSAYILSQCWHKVDLKAYHVVLIIMLIWTHSSHIVFEVSRCYNQGGIDMLTPKNQCVITQLWLWVNLEHIYVVLIILPHCV